MSAAQLFLTHNMEKMSAAELFLMPNMEQQNGQYSRPPYSALQPAAAAAATTKNNGKGTTQKKSGHKKKSGKGSGGVFRIHENTINGGKADKAGVFGFGNKYIGRKKQVEESSTEEESDTSEDEE